MTTPEIISLSVSALSAVISALAFFLTKHWRKNYAIPAKQLEIDERKRAADAARSAKLIAVPLPTEPKKLPRFAVQNIGLCLAEEVVITSPSPNELQFVITSHGATALIPAIAPGASAVVYYRSSSYDELERFIPCSYVDALGSRETKLHVYL